MSFTLAVLIVVSCAAVVLGLVCYHLLSRVLLLERAVQGGIEAPTRRLTREEFERRFSSAAARASLSDRFDTGVVLFLGAEADHRHPIVMALRNLARPDLVTVVPVSPVAAAVDLGSVSVVLSTDLETTVGVGPEILGVTTTPFAFVVDDRRIRIARPVAGVDDLLGLLHEST